ncbi:MAG: carbohydrate ABC transporter permease [bacterium]
MTTKDKVIESIKYLILSIIFVVAFFPLVWMVLTSFKERSEVFTGSVWPEKFIIDNYIFIFTQMNIEVHFINTIIVTFFTVISVVLFASMAGYIFAKIKFPGRNILFIIFIASLTIPPQVTIIPLFLQLRDMSLLNTRTGLIFSYIGLGMAFSIFLMRAFFQTMPDALRESAIIDGASEFQVFWKIMLPMAKPGIATITIFQFVNTWNEFMYATTFIQKTSLRTLQPAIRSLVGRYSTNWSALSAAMVLGVLPILAIFLIMQKQFIAGLTAGALKG